MNERWKQLSFEQLRGADYAFRMLRTSPVIRGQALCVLDEQLLEVREEISMRTSNVVPVENPQRAGKSKRRAI